MLISLQQCIILHYVSALGEDIEEEGKGENKQRRRGKWIGREEDGKVKISWQDERRDGRGGQGEE